MNDKTLKGKIIKSLGRTFLISYKDEIINGYIPGKFRTTKSDCTNPVAVGDDVLFCLQEDKNAKITEILPRKNQLVRQSTNLSKKRHILASNIDQALIIVSLKKPATPIEFIDRCLVSCNADDIPAIILFNKIDIYNQKDKIQLKNLMEIYSKIGYECYSASILEQINTDKIKNILTHKTTLIIGNSGVGKSSLINLVSPHNNLKTNEVSEKHKTGRHTTTFAQMYKTDEDSFVVDSPGIKAFGLLFLDKTNLGRYFPEISKIAEQCKYHNCRHTDEPQCAVKEAFSKNQIAESRFKSYLNILYENNEKYRP